MRTSVTLTLKLENEGVRTALLDVLAPDNKELPKGLALSVRVEGSEAEFQVDSPSASTSLSTVLALLRDVTLFQEVWLLSHGKDARVRRLDSD